MLLAVWQSDAAYQLYGTPKYLTGAHVLMALAAMACVALGQRLGEATGKLPQTLSEADELPLERWFYITWGLALFGYLVWFGLAWKNGLSLGVVRDLIAGADEYGSDALRADYLGTIPGVTTCVQFGIAAAVLGSWLLMNGKRNVLLPLLVLLGLAGFRAIVNSERLALIELLIPAGLVALRVAVLGREWARLLRSAWQMAPLAAVLGLFVLFGVFESYRSWTYYSKDFDSLAEFTIWRLGGYYTTAHNNGAMAWELRGAWPLPYITFAQFWEFPLVENSPLAYSALTGIQPSEVHAEMLERYGSAELNNQGGLFGPALDFGLAGFGIYWMAYGFVAGRLYRGFLIGSVLGVMLYPVILVSILEVPRLNYIHTTRTLPPLVILVLIDFILRRAAHASRQSATSPAQEGMACIFK